VEEADQTSLGSAEDTTLGDSKAFGAMNSLKESQNNNFVLKAVPVFGVKEEEDEDLFVMPSLGA